MALSMFDRVGKKKKPKPIDVDISHLREMLPVEEKALMQGTAGQTEVMPRTTPGGAVQNIPLSDIRVQGELSDGTVVHPRQAQHNEEDEALRESIKHHGIQVPLIVRPAGALDSFRYIVVKGSRRYYEAQALGLETVPCIVRDLSRSQATLLSLILTTHHKGLSIHEKGRAVAQVKTDMQNAIESVLQKALPDISGKPTRRQLDTIIAEYSDREVHPEVEDWLIEALENGRETGRRPKATWGMIAPRIGITERRIQQYLDAAGLPPEVHAAIESEQLNERQVRAVASLPSESLQKKLASEIMRKGLSSSEAMARAKELRGSFSEAPNSSSNGQSTLPVETPSQRRDRALRELRETTGTLRTATEALLKLRESEGEFAPLLKKEVADLSRSLRAQLKRLDEVI